MLTFRTLLIKKIKESDVGVYTCSAKNKEGSAESSGNLEIVEIAGLPLYNQDLDDSPPREWVEFRNKLKTFDGVIFVTPEYNRSVPAPLKNAIDVASRPYGQSAWSGKPAGIVSCSPGAMGAFGANHHLRQSLVFLNMPILQQPEAYIGNAAQLFNPAGGFANDSTQQFMGKFLNAYGELVAMVTASHAKS